jgi:hypothetical protein
LTDLTTRAAEHDGAWIVNGQKRWCSGGGHAEGYLVYCRFGEIKGSKGHGVYIERDCRASFGARAADGIPRIHTADISSIKCIGRPIIPGAGRPFGKPMEAFDPRALRQLDNARSPLPGPGGGDRLCAGASIARQTIVEFQAVQPACRDGNAGRGGTADDPQGGGRKELNSSVLLSSMAKCFTTSARCAARRCS